MTSYFNNVLLPTLSIANFLQYKVINARRQCFQTSHSPKKQNTKKVGLLDMIEVIFANCIGYCNSINVIFH